MVKCTCRPAFKNKCRPGGAGMIDTESVKTEFVKNRGILETSDLNDLGFSSRQIKKMVEEGTLHKIKYGFYEWEDYNPREEVIIAKLFPESVIFLESALMYYGYIDRIPSEWQIAVDRNNKTTKYNIEYPFIKPYFIETKFIRIGLNQIEVDGVLINIYDRDRTICDTLRYQNKLDSEVFTNAIIHYVEDPKKNVRRLFEYAEKFNITNKVQTYIGVWL